MYLRTTQRRNTDGSVVRYVQVAHNRRVDGVTQAEVLLNLGREDRLDGDGLRRLVGSINRYLGETDGDDDAVELAGDAWTVIESRPAGTAWLLDGLWRQLGVDTALAKVLGGRRFTTDVERVLFAMVANRAIDPLSKLATAEWACNDRLAESDFGGHAEGTRSSRIPRRNVRDHRWDLLQLAIDHAILDVNVLGPVYRCDKRDVLRLQSAYLHGAHRMP